MQKKLIALAIAGLASSAAFAQTNVVMYGVADLNMESVKVSGTADSETNVPNKFRGASNSSYFGIKGSEDLGSGLKVVFQLETGITFSNNNRTDTDGGAGASHSAGNSQFGAARDSFLGMEGDFGKVVLGTVTAPTRALGTMVSNSPGAAGTAYTGIVYGTIAGIKTGSDDRVTNAVSYTSPNFSGVTLSAVLSSEGNKNKAGAGEKSLNGRLFNLGLNYGNGPLTVGYAYLNDKDGQLFSDMVESSYNDKLTGHRLAGKFDLGQGTTIAALWDRQKYTIDSLDDAESGNMKRDAWQVAIAHRMGANQLGLEFAKAGKIKVDGDSINGTELKQVSLQYSYDLSKRTMIKAYFTKLTTKDTSDSIDYAPSFYNNPISSSNCADGDSTALGVGLRHAF